jgi:hypothetical protein
MSTRTYNEFKNPGFDPSLYIYIEDTGGMVTFDLGFRLGNRQPSFPSGKAETLYRGTEQPIRYLPCMGMSLATLQRVNSSSKSGVVRNAGNAAHPVARPPGSGRSEWLTPG